MNYNYIKRRLSNIILPDKPYLLITRVAKDFLFTIKDLAVHQDIDKYIYSSKHNIV